MIFGTQHIERRVTALEVEVKGISDDVKGVQATLNAIAQKIDSNSQADAIRADNIATNAEQRMHAREVQHSQNRRFTLGIIVTLIAAGMGIIGAFTTFMVGSLTESKIHPLHVDIIRTREQLRSAISMAQKAVDDSNVNMANMYKEITGKDWVMPQTTFPTSSEMPDGSA